MAAEANRGLPACRIELRHACRWPACLDRSCELCQNSHDVCKHDLSPSQKRMSLDPKDVINKTGYYFKSSCHVPVSIRITGDTGSLAQQATHLKVFLVDADEVRETGITRALREGTQEWDWDHPGLSVVAGNELIKYDEEQHPRAFYWRAGDGHLRLPITAEHFQEKGQTTHVYVADLESKNNDELARKAFCLVVYAEHQDWRQMTPLRNIRPLLSTPFYLYSRRREGKQDILCRESKLTAIEGISQKTSEKFTQPGGLRSGCRRFQPAEELMLISDKPIENAGALHDYLENKTDDFLERVSTGILNRHRPFVQEVRELLRSRMVRMLRDQRPRCWQGAELAGRGLALKYTADRGSINFDVPPSVVDEGTGAPVSGAMAVGEVEEVGNWRRLAVADWHSPQHPGWRIFDQPAAAMPGPPDGAHPAGIWKSHLWQQPLVHMNHDSLHGNTPSKRRMPFLDDLPPYKAQRGLTYSHSNFDPNNINKDVWGMESVPPFNAAGARGSEHAADDSRGPVGNLPEHSALAGPSFSLGQGYQHQTLDEWQPSGIGNQQSSASGFMDHQPSAYFPQQYQQPHPLWHASQHSQTGFSQQREESFDDLSFGLQHLPLGQPQDETGESNPDFYPQ